MSDFIGRFEWENQSRERARRLLEYKSACAYVTVGRLKNKMAAGVSVRAKLQANLNEFSSLTR